MDPILLIVVIVLVVLYVRGGPYGIERGYYSGRGYYGGGGLGLVLLVLLLLYLTGHLGTSVRFR